MHFHILVCIFSIEGQQKTAQMGCCPHIIRRSQPTTSAWPEKTEEQKMFADRWPATTTTTTKNDEDISFCWRYGMFVYI